MKYTVVFMDADDTIFDFHAAEYQALKSACELCKVDFDDETAHKYSIINDELWKSLERGEITRKQLHRMRFERLCGYIGLAADENIVMRLSTAYIDALGQQTIQLDDSFSVLKQLSKLCKIYIVTNGISQVQRSRFEKSGLKNFVDGIFISDEMGVSKPSKLFFERVLEETGTKDKSSVLVVGDSLTSDMQGGRNAEIDTCLFDPKNKIDMPNPLCDYKITRIKDLLELVDS